MSTVKFIEDSNIWNIILKIQHKKVTELVRFYFWGIYATWQTVTFIENISLQEWKQSQKLCEIYRVIKNNKAITQQIALYWFTPTFNTWGLEHLPGAQHRSSRRPWQWAPHTHSLTWCCRCSGEDTDDKQTYVPGGCNDCRES